MHLYPMPLQVLISLECGRAVLKVTLESVARVVRVEVVFEVRLGFEGFLAEIADVRPLLGVALSHVCLDRVLGVEHLLALRALDGLDAIFVVRGVDMGLEITHERCPVVALVAGEAFGRLFPFLRVPPPHVRLHRTHKLKLLAALRTMPALLFPRTVLLMLVQVINEKEHIALLTQLTTTPTWVVLLHVTL